jgi:EAL domain-containing protein (putative c-di-GMP-specific phosphodiesterase class I)/CheY-like chemotaxis protein/GGDEF domain-containing protein
MSNEDLIAFVDEPDGPAPGAKAAEAPSEGGTASRLPPWRVLVVDDDQDVHESTDFALRGLRVADRSLVLLHAHSAAEGLEVLRGEPDVAVILLDVVMETEHAGLELVDRIRGELGMTHVRIILRTGQPGQAPELETIRRYDINDYKTKSELTRSKLYATLTAAVRSYDQLRKIEASRRGLEKIVEASNQFIADQGLQTFAEGVITQFAGLIGVDPQGVVCATKGLPDARAVPGRPVVIAAAGAYRHLIQKGLDEIDNADIAHSLRRALDERRSEVGERSVTLFFPGRQRPDGKTSDAHQDFAAYIGANVPLQPVDQHLLQVFCTNISLCADNVTLVAELKRLAFFDSLKIPNRNHIIEELQIRCFDGRIDDTVIAKIDIDQFIESDGVFGDGDSMLLHLWRSLSARMTGCFVGRSAGKTFVVLGPSSAVTETQLQGLRDEEAEINGIRRRLSLSMGFVRCREVAPQDPHVLLRAASFALKQAKTLGQGRTEWYTQAIAEDSKERTELLHHLYQAYGHDRLFLMYQPQVSLADGRCIGVEALMRWRNIDGELVSPDRFIPVAEQSGLIVHLGRWGLATALHTLGNLHRAGHRSLHMAVNVSAVQFGHPDFLKSLDEVLSQKGVDPRFLELEITESVSVLGMERVLELLHEIRRRRITLSIDDFGTGFSSLSYLHKLPADRLKIDKSFVQALDSADAKAIGRARIARMIVPLGRQMELKVVAEGVETERQEQILQELGCDVAQGFYYAKPLVFDDLLDWLAARRVSHPGA